MSLVALASCAPGAEELAAGSSAVAVVASCPEAVRPDDRGDPRNAADRIRFCWPGEAKCYCDRDNDCYALEGYVACVPVPWDGGVFDAGSRKDVATVDVSRVEAGALDASRLDAGVTDVARVDAPRVDAGATDAGTVYPPSRVWGATPPSSIPSFPGAEGFGASASGGRGGRVVVVTNLAASGPGSLQDALNQSGPRTVVFRVSGVIPGAVRIAHGDVTIAGQTSPGGVTVRGIDTTEEPYCDQQCGASARGVDNVVIRHLRSRPSGGDFPDGLRIRYARWVMVDHVSVGNAIDEAAEISYANNITVQNTLLAETAGGHAAYGGMLVNYTNPAAGFALDRISLLRNNWNRIMGRYPELSRESGTAAAGTTLRIEITNNLFWDQRFYADINPTVQSGNNAAAAVQYEMNYVGNMSVVKAGYRYGMLFFPNPTGRSRAFLQDDCMNLYPNRVNWALEHCCNDLPTQPATRPAPSYATTARLPFPAVSTMPANMVRTFVGANVGAFPRDPMDTRLMSFVLSNTIDARRSDRNPVGDALRTAFTTAPAAPVDTDNDGMPDAWERTNGLNPAVQDHNGAQLSVAKMGRAGYTNLECYLEELSALRIMTNR